MIFLICYVVPQNKDEWLDIDEKQEADLEKAIRIFSKYDADISGTIDSTEFGNVHADLVEQGFRLKPLDECFHDLDHDDSGSISFTEFLPWLVDTGSFPNLDVPHHHYEVE